MKSVALVGYALLAVANCAAYSQTVPTGRAQLIVSVDLGELPQSPIFWHLYNYATRAAAEIEASKAPRTTVVEAFDKVWLYSLAAKDWHPMGGERVANIGPLPGSSGFRGEQHCGRGHNILTMPLRMAGKSITGAR